jgi:hypothetical protein
LLVDAKVVVYGRLLISSSHFMPSKGKVKATPRHPTQVIERPKALTYMLSSRWQVTVLSGYFGEILDSAQSFAEVVVVETRRKEAGSKARCFCRRFGI